MGSIRNRPQSNTLFIDFRYQGKRYREQTDLRDNKTNRKKLERKLSQIEREISAGTFSYEKHFPDSAKAKICKTDKGSSTEVTSHNIAPAQATHNRLRATPTFEAFAQEWLAENKVAWRRSHQINMESMMNKYFLPAFSKLEVGSITRADLLKFRSSLAKVPGRNGNTTLSNNRINKIMDPLRRIFEEAADRYEFTTPFVRIKPLKMQKSDVQPFTLSEVQLILDNVRADYKNYFILRFYTGMRTGEIDGLQWRYIDFDRRMILVRQTLVDREIDYTKTDASQREIYMSEPVYQALLNQQKATYGISKFVFCNTKGDPLEQNNVTKRVWYPMLAQLGLKKRRPYQTRHTAATLWLAAGEAPEWIARQMGHANTEMLFRVYSRFVPNLTRQDGSAFEKLIQQATEVNHD